MSQREELSSMFEYDRWANLRWIDTARSLGHEAVLLHIVEAQVVWLSRIENIPGWNASLDRLPLDIECSVRAWQRMLMGADLGRVVSYSTSGAHYDNLVSEIARHVINHGSYHRGQLRGIASERGVEFPESDYILFCRER